MGNPVPITIITGFLGSGKTTLINYILEDLGGKEKLAIIKNEIGDVAVDSKIIRGKNIVMKELLNGCVCCTLVGSLEDSLKELVETVHPDRIIIEASGAANPAILAVNLDRLNFVKRDLIVTVIDALHFEGYKDKSVVVQMQQKFTDLIVLNRVGDVDEDRIDRVLDDIYEVRPGIPVVKTATGRVDPDVLFGLLKPVGTLEMKLSDVSHQDHLQEDEIEYFSYKSTGFLDVACVENVLHGLSEEYYRVKGFIWATGATSVKLVNFVCGRLEVSDVLGLLEDLVRGENQLVFIGTGIKRYESGVVEKLGRCCCVG